MGKYKIEGEIDFYAELYKSLDIEEEENKTEEDNNKCLITNQPLIDKYITMKCGHKFNYIPLYNDLSNHKQKFNNMEGSNRLQICQIRCPYCRKKQNELLPYYEELGLKKINGVNFYDSNIKPAYTINYHNSIKCEYQIISPNFDESKPETEINKKYYNCGVGFATKIELYNDNKCYCYSHKKLMIKNYKTIEKEKAKEIAKKEKEKAKELIKSAKETEKQKLKEEKQKLKEEKQKVKDIDKSFKKNSIQNVILGVSVISTEQIPNQGCVQILKTGPNKGKYCGCKVKTDDLCTRHFKINNNNNNN